VKKKPISILAAVVVGILVYLWPLGLGQPAQAVLAIIFFAGTLWFTEALPLWVTALIVPPLLVVGAAQTPKAVYTPFFDPIIALLLGGFFLARALQKHKLDIRIARLFLRVFGNKPRMYLLGLMAATAFLSFWISNTASALLMIPIGIAAITASGLVPMKSSYSKSVVLGIGYAATAGGVGTLIGSPPNLIAVRFLADAGMSLSFLDWMVYAMPPAIIMVVVAWAILSLMHKPDLKEVKAPEIKDSKLNRNQKLTLVVFALTAFLWVTESFHGVHNSIVAMIPVVGFYALGVLGKDDLPKVGWGVLILVGGGLTLGSAIHAVGLDMVIAQGLAGVVSGQWVFLVFFLIAMFSVVFTAFVANTAGAAVLVPIMLPCGLLCFGCVG
jgi:sodium-dependent dicarboxylate transporter 2/3/5